MRLGIGMQNLRLECRLRRIQHLPIRMLRKKDENGDNVPDKYQIKVTFDATTEGTIAGTDDQTQVIYLTKTNDAGYEANVYPTEGPAVDVKNPAREFEGWNLGANAGQVIPEDAEDITYTATYKDALQTVTLTFQIAPEDQTKGTFEGGIYTYTDSQITGEKLTAPMVNDAEGDDWAFAGWNPAVTEDTLVPEEGITYTAVWAADMNHDNRPDDAQMVAITFDTTDTAKGYFGDRQQTTTVEMLPGTSLQPDGFTDVSGDSWAFDGWVDANGQEVTIVPGTDAAYTAKWAVDWNHNNVPDADEGYVPPSSSSDGSDESSSSDSDGSSTYTVGTDGRWVHMDPQDPQSPSP